MDKKATMIRGSDGYYWLQTIDATGRVRSSYCGNLGAVATVEAWCLGRGIEFRQVEPFVGPGVRTRRPVQSGRDRVGSVAS